MTPKPTPPLRVTACELTLVEPAGSPQHCCAVVEIKIQDGRQFSILAATPSWFEEAFINLGLRCYFGPLVLFVRAMEPALVRRAMDDMASGGDRFLCLYDTPRRTLPQVLADFKSRHP